MRGNHARPRVVISPAGTTVVPCLYEVAVVAPKSLIVEILLHDDVGEVDVVVLVVVVIAKERVLVEVVEVLVLVVVYVVVEVDVIVVVDVEVVVTKQILWKPSGLVNPLPVPNQTPSNPPPMQDVLLPPSYSTHPVGPFCVYPPEHLVCRYIPSAVAAASQPSGVSMEDPCSQILPVPKLTLYVSLPENGRALFVRMLPCRVLTLR